jgi:transcriptional regulator with XRE-family HTH domain
MRVDAAMAAAGIATRDELAERLGIKPSTLSESLANASDNIRLRTLLRLAKEFRLSIEYLVEGLDPAYDATRSEAPVPEQVVDLWQRAVQQGHAEAVWRVLAVMGGESDKPMPRLRQLRQQPDPAAVG